jgi:hypothetical protein
VGGGAKHHSAYHRVFSAARWSLDELGLAVFALAPAPAPALPPPGGVILLGVDDTLARKRGPKVFGVGMHHDPLLSTRRTSVKNWGHCWVVLGRAGRAGQAAAVRGPPAGSACRRLFRLYVPRKAAEKKGLAYRTKPELAVQMLALLWVKSKIVCKRGGPTGTPGQAANRSRTRWPIAWRTRM